MSLRFCKTVDMNIYAKIMTFFFFSSFGQDVVYITCLIKYIFFLSYTVQIKKHNYPGTIRGTILRKFPQLFVAYFHKPSPVFWNLYFSHSIKEIFFLFLTLRQARQIVDWAKKKKLKQTNPVSRFTWLCTGTGYGVLTFSIFFAQGSYQRGS